ncbi:hypothetical protein MEO94_31375, partial [Dolichospermum sp. ST_sed9]|nr:hypothetical protein [Dolichospermum sp. ST_sed9]
CHLSFVICHLSFVICHLSFVICHLSFVIRELHKKNELLAAALRYPILWDGHLVPPCIISRQDACTTREFGIFFYLEVS